MPLDRKCRIVRASFVPRSHIAGSTRSCIYHHLQEVISNSGGICYAVEIHKNNITKYLHLFRTKSEHEFVPGGDGGGSGGFSTKLCEDTGLIEISSILRLLVGACYGLY
jgi:hypothetical protein